MPTLRPTPVGPVRRTDIRLLCVSNVYRRVRSLAAQAGVPRSTSRRLGLLLSAAVVAAITGALPALSAGRPGATELASAAVAATHPALLPNMTPLHAKDLHIERAAGHRWLRLESGLANLGRGPMEVRSRGTPVAVPRDSVRRRKSSITTSTGRAFSSATSMSRSPGGRPGAWCSTGSTTTGTSSPRHDSGSFERVDLRSLLPARRCVCRAGCRTDGTACRSG